MKLNVEQLRKFKANSSSIKTNPLLPILGYLKFDKNGFVTKNAMDKFVIQRIDCTESFLVDETVLMNLVNYTSSPTIEVILKDKKVILFDGSTRKESPSDDLNNFPVNDSSDDKPVTIDKDVLESIGIASQFVVDQEIPQVTSYVFVGKKCVCGSNGHIAYIDEFVEDLPTMTLDKYTSMLISKYESVKFSENDSYYFFEMDGCKFGIIKPEFKWFDETSFAVFDNPVGSFTMDKGELIGINEMVINDSPLKYANVTIEVKDSKLFFETNDTGYERTTQRKFQVEADRDIPQFVYNAALMNKLLRAVPDSELTFSFVEGRIKDTPTNKYFITGESGFVSLIIGLTL